MATEGKLENSGRHSCRPSKIRVSKREDRFDRISELPDSILLCILSYMFIDDAVSTSLLSKRWRNLWNSMDSLDFPMACANSKRNSIEFIERALSLYEGFKIMRFCVRFRYNSNYISEFDSWVQFAVDRNVEKLVLDFFCVETGLQPYVLPESIYKSGSLKELEVNLCSFRTTPSLCLRSLKKLVINNTVFTGGLLSDLISGCPILEELTLVNCNQASDLEVIIMNQNLKRMKIVEFPDESEEGTEVKIFAPYLLYLELHSEDPRPFIIQNASSIVSAHLDIRKIVTCLSFDTHNQKNNFQILQNMIKGIHNVQSLKLSNWCVQAMVREEGTHDCLTTPLRHLKHLELDVQLTRDELPGIACLLRNFYELERLTIQLCRQAHMDRSKMEPIKNANASHSISSEGSFWESHEATFYNLKKVTVKNFRGEENEVMFLAFLLRNSAALKKVIILLQPKHFSGSGESYAEYCSKSGNVSKKYIENVRKLLASPRSSDTEILFSGIQPSTFL